MTLGAFIRRRSFQALVTLLVLTLLVHAAITIIPGDPVRALFGFRRPPQELLDEIRAQYRLDDPYLVQYLTYLGQLVRGDLGRTISLRPVPVSTLVGRALPVSGALVGLSVLLQLFVGYATGVIATLRRSGLLSRLATWVGVLATATPIILTAYLLRSVFTIGYQGLGWFKYRWIGDVQSYVLPVLALSAMLIGPVVLILRSELIEGMASPYAKLAIASGIPSRRVVALHVAKASTGPVIAYVAANLGYLMAGLAVVEAAYGIPGVGNLIISSIQDRNRPVVIGAVLVVSAIVILINMLAEIVAAWLDPRLRFDRAVPS